jgi:DNA-binding NtrC family response regulator
LLRAEALVRTGKHARAAAAVAEAVAPGEPVPMETLAEVHRVAAIGLAAAGDLPAAGAAFERAARILGTVGNQTARTDLLEQYAEAVWPSVRSANVAFPGRSHRDRLPAPPARVAVRLDAVSRLVPAASTAAAGTASRAATILDAGGYPEVLAHEVAALLLDTGAATAGVLACRAGDAPPEIHAWWGCGWCEARALTASAPRRIDLGNWHGRRFEIALRPAEGMEAAVTLLAAEKLARGARWQDQARREERERSALWPVEPGGGSEDAIFLSQGMTDLVASVRRVAPLNVLVLLTGETGTGKEVVARVIHGASGRGTRPFVPFNCTAVPREMVDSQLFGYRRGAFTGAVADFPGVIRAAAGGTLFLDEIGELGLDVQPKLLRFLESGEIQPLGDPRPGKVEVRVVASTNAHLEQLVAEGRFREDLFYRLAVVRFPIPPLRERREEIPALAQHFLERAARDFQKEPLSLADESVEYLTLYRWPGNVRQLANEMRRLAALAEKGAVLMPEHLDSAIIEGRRTVPAAERTLTADELVVRLDQPLDAAVEHLERAALQRAIAASGGRVEDAARLLGLSRKGLYLKRQRLGIE